DENVIVGNIVRVVENVCHEELVTLNRGIGHLLGKPHLEASATPLGPATIVSSFAEALGTLEADNRARFLILKELNQAPLGEIAAVYSDAHSPTDTLPIVPPGPVRPAGWRGKPATQQKRAADDKPDAAQSSPEMDVMAMFRRISSHGGFPLT